MVIQVFPHGIESDYAKGGKNPLYGFDNEILLRHSELTKVFKIDNGVRSTKVLIIFTMNVVNRFQLGQ